MLTILRHMLMVAALHISLPTGPSTVRLIPTRRASRARALTIVEYVLMAGVIILIIGIIGTVFSSTITDAFQAIQDAFDANTP